MGILRVLRCLAKLGRKGKLGTLRVLRHLGVLRSLRGLGGLWGLRSLGLLHLTHSLRGLVTEGRIRIKGSVWAIGSPSILRSPGRISIVPGVTVLSGISQVSMILSLAGRCRIFTARKESFLIDAKA